MIGNDARVGLAVALLAVLTSTALEGCSSELDLAYAPDNCTRVPPETGHLIAKVTINPQNTAVKVTVFVGDWENNAVAAEDSARADRVAFELSADAYYSVLARYVVGPDTVLVLDGAKLEVKREEFRDATCFSVPDTEVDVRLSASNAHRGDAKSTVASREPDPDAVGGPGSGR
jgi:hypothetical protein